MAHISMPVRTDEMWKWLREHDRSLPKYAEKARIDIKCDHGGSGVLHYWPSDGTSDVVQLWHGERLAMFITQWQLVGYEHVSLYLDKDSWYVRLEGSGLLHRRWGNG